MKRTPIKRWTPLRRTSSKPRRERKASRYRTRPRFVGYMLWVKTLPCLMAWQHDECEGVVEADHAGRRGIGQKAHDNTCIPLCTKHHRQRHDFTGSFARFTHGVMRAWLAAAIERTQAAARLAGIEVPT